MCNIQPLPQYQLALATPTPAPAEAGEAGATPEVTEYRGPADEPGFVPPAFEMSDHAATHWFGPAARPPAAATAATLEAQATHGGTPSTNDYLCLAASLIEDDCKPSTYAESMVIGLRAHAARLRAATPATAATEAATLLAGVKTYQAWEDGPEMSATDYLQPGDEVDEEMVNHFGGVVSPQYCTHYFTQVGEAQYERDGRFHYMTFGLFGERYLYLGILPPFKQPKR